MELKMPADDKSFFKKGTFVEVSSNSEGFNGVWYEGKVLEPPPPATSTPSLPKTKKDRFYHIEYRSLLCDDGSEKALTEYIECSFVRPLPPNDEFDLQVNDVVDAMHLDGWWIGVVVKVTQSNIYSVYFENPPELLKFKRHELRAHWDWEGGKWVRPQKRVAKVSSRILRHGKDVYDGMLQYEEQTPCSGTANPEETDIVANCMKLKSIANKKGRARSLKRRRGGQQKTSAKGKKCDGSSDTVDVLVLKDYDSTDVKSPISTGESKRTKHDGAGDDVDKLVIKYHEIDDGLSIENMEESKVGKHDGAGSSVDKFAFKDHAIDADSAKNAGSSEGTKNDGAGGMLQCEEQIPCSGTANPEETDIVANCMKLKSIAKKKGRAGSVKRRRGEQQKTSAKGKSCDGFSDTVDVLVLKDYDSTDVKSPISTGESKRTKHDGAGDDVDKLVIKYHKVDDGLSIENMEESKVGKHGQAGSSVDKFAFKDHAIDADSAKNAGSSEGTKNDGAGGMLQYEEQIPCSGTANPEETDFLANCMKLKSIAKKKGRAGSVKRRGEQQKTSAKGKNCDGFSDTVDVLVVLKDCDSTDVKSPISTGESKRTKHDGAGDDVDKLVINYHEIDDGLSTENMEESKFRKHDGAGSSVDKFAFKDHAIDADSAKNSGSSEGTKNDGAGGMLQYEEQIPCSGTANPEETEFLANCKKLKWMGKKKGRAGSLKRKRGEQQITSAKGKKCDESSDTVDVLVLKDYDSTDVKSPIRTGESKRTKHDGARDDVDKLVIKHHEIDDGLSTENMEESKVRKHDGAGSSVDKFAFKDHAIDADSAKNTGDSEGTKNDGAGGDVGNMILKYPVIIDAESPTNKAESKDKECDGAGVAVNKMDLQDCASNGVEPSKMTGESKGSEDASAEKAAYISDTGCSMREAEMAIVQLPVNMDTVAKPISMFDGLCYRKIVIDSRFLCGRTVNQNQRNKAKGKLIEIVKESTANDSVSDIIRDENQCFHGMEPSSMWKTFIESVEVLETIPQKPHFHPLKKCKEMYRDGIAFGYMITFAKLVKRTSELQVNDPKSIFDSISETLQDIELYGFDVQPIRNRLTELQLMKDRQEQLQEASKEFEHQIVEHTHEQMKINAEFAEVVEEMKLLEEKKRKIMLLMQEKDSKITELKSNLDVCNQDIQNSQLDFESLAAAPW